MNGISERLQYQDGKTDSEGICFRATDDLEEERERRRRKRKESGGLGNGRIEEEKYRQKSVPSTTKASKVKFWQCGLATSRGICFTAR